MTIPVLLAIECDDTDHWWSYMRQKINNLITKSLKLLDEKYILAVIKMHCYWTIHYSTNSSLTEEFNWKIQKHIETNDEILRHQTSKAPDKETVEVIGIKSNVSNDRLRHCWTGMRPIGAYITHWLHDHPLRDYGNWFMYSFETLFRFACKANNWLTLRRRFSNFFWQYFLSLPMIRSNDSKKVIKYSSVRSKTSAQLHKCRARYGLWARFDGSMVGRQRNI